MLSFFTLIVIITIADSFHFYSYTSYRFHDRAIQSKSNTTDDTVDVPYYIPTWVQEHFDHNKPTKFKKRNYLKHLDSIMKVKKSDIKN